MKRLLLYTLFVTLFAACTKNEINEQSVNRQEVPKTLTVGFEGDDTRIQLQNGKTVWTKGDHVSVFYRSTINEEWQFMGETGDRTGQIVPVDNSVNPPASHNHVVVAYPYSADYFYNTETHNVEASLPAVQNYLKDSYGTNGNIMISSSEFNKVSLKSVCGWLKLQLTGDGEVVKSITLRGNDGEQIAGLIYVDSATATATLASVSGEAGDGEVGGTLVRPGTILTEVTLDCGEGVALGKNTTAFYIALPPQTFENGFTVEIEDTEGYVMEQSTNNVVSIERNTIKPMAAFEFSNPNLPTQPTPASNEIWYTNGSTTEPTAPNKPAAFGNATIQSNTYDAKKECWVITLDKDVTEIGDYAFRNCKSLTSVTIPDSVTTIGDNAFEYCDSLTSVTIPDSVTTIGSSAFCYCTSLTSVTIPDSVTTIGGWAFNNCISLTSVTIPDSVTTIGGSAFSLCESLTSVTIGNSVTTIGNGAFSGCASLKEFKGKFAADNGRCLIKDNTIIAYAEASGTTYTIPDSVTTIGNYAFKGCASLTSVTIPDSVTTIGYEAFRDCTSLTSVTIPDSVTTIGDYAFYYCKSLTSVTIGNSVTTIGDAAFNSCASLTSITIPDSVTTIGVDAFRYCYSLTSVYCKAVTPPALGGTSVFYINGSGRKIYVPAESVDAYNSATNWSEYASAIVGYDFEKGEVVE